MTAMQQFAETLASPAVVERIGWLLVHSLWQFTLVASFAIALGLPSPECKRALENEFEISADGQEGFRYYESALPGLKPAESNLRLRVYITHEGDCRIDDPAWEMGQPREVKCALRDLRETLTVLVEKIRNRYGADHSVIAFLSCRPTLPIPDLLLAVEACHQAGILAPTPPNELVSPRSLPVGSASQSDTRLEWRARGRVVDGVGKPLAGVTVRAATGYGTLRGGGSGVTDAEGRYDFRFGLGIMFGDLRRSMP